jgi:hypothetical protein
MKFFSDLLRVALCVAGALLLAEIGMRISGERFQASFYIPEPERGYALRPGAEGWNVGEHENYVRINSQGLRDREHNLNRPPDTLRIAVIGDSETEAVQVPLEQTYFQVAERELNRTLPSGSPKIEVINFGVGGYGLGPQYLTVQEQIWKYDPQIVIVADPIDAYIMRSTRRLYFGDSFGAPFFAVHDGNLELDPQTAARRMAPIVPNPRQVIVADLMNRSRLLSLANSARVKAANNFHQMTSGFQAKAEAVSTLPPDYWRVFPYYGPANADLKDGWATSEALILAIRHEVSRHHAEFWLFMLDMPGQVDPDSQESAKLRKRLGVDTLFRSEQLLGDFASHAGIRHVALAPELQQYSTERNLVLHGFPGMPRNTGHLNENGHLAVGQLIARALRESSPHLSREPLEPRKETDGTSARGSDLSESRHVAAETDAASYRNTGEKHRRSDCNLPGAQCQDF